MKFIEDIETNIVQLHVLECKCGYHIGIDATFLDQVGHATITCPSCEFKCSTSSIKF